MTLEVDYVRQLLVDIIKTKPDIQVKDYNWLNQELKNKYIARIESNQINCLKEINGLSNCLYWGIVEDIYETYGRTIEKSTARNLLKKLVKDYGLQEDLSL